MIHQQRILMTQQVDDDDGVERITPAGSIVEISDVIEGQENCLSVGCLETGGSWFFTPDEWYTETINPFESVEKFRKSLQLHRQSTIYLLMERKVEEMLEDGRHEIVGCLTIWAMDGIDLGNDEVLTGLAENSIDEESE